MMTPYTSRFAPSPTGPLHAGSLVAAMASYLDAKAHKGQWLVRIEDIDATRTMPGATETILQALIALGMHWDREIVWQSRRKSLYEAAFQGLKGYTYPCGCTRREIADSQTEIIASEQVAVYPGTCRNGVPFGKMARTHRLRVPDSNQAIDCITFNDRWMGNVTQQLASAVGDFVLKRADGFWAYQLAVVVDDAEQGITHVVRGADLLDSTPRQIYLQRLLKLTTPHYMHVPVMTNQAGEKLSKQTGASALDLRQPEKELRNAAQFLGLPIKEVKAIGHFWEEATAAWAQRFLTSQKK